MPSASRTTDGAAVIIVAAGRGTRLGTPDKILIPLAGRPLLSYAIDAAEASRSVHDVIVVAGLHTKLAIERLVTASRWKKVRHVALGGERRQDSVEAGLRLVDASRDVVVVHDGARPMVTSETFDRCIASARAHGAAIAAVPVVDTLKRVSGELIDSTVSRDGLWAAQTPQAVRTALLREAFAHANALHLDVTDEAGLMEAYGLGVRVVPGSPWNVKVTRPDDVPFVEALLHARPRSEAAR